jgi:hypothetical protein
MPITWEGLNPRMFFAAAASAARIVTSAPSR